jgi:hypothetical protein
VDFLKRAAKLTSFLDYAKGNNGCG